MIRWLHHLFNPHCPDCAEEKNCQNCETLHRLLLAERDTNQKLLATILEMNKPVIEVQREPMKMPEPINSGQVPWRVKKEMLENEDRAKAKILREQAEVAKMEKELGIASVGVDDAS